MTVFDSFSQKYLKQSTFETQVLENFWGPVENFGALYDDKYLQKNDDLLHSAFSEV